MKTKICRNVCVGCFCFFKRCNVETDLNCLQRDFQVEANNLNKRKSESPCRLGRLGRLGPRKIDGFSISRNSPSPLDTPFVSRLSRYAWYNMRSRRRRRPWIHETLPNRPWKPHRFPGENIHPKGPQLSIFFSTRDVCFQNKNRLELRYLTVDLEISKSTSNLHPK